MSERHDLVAAIAEAASDWRDPEHERRRDAEERTIQADNTFTREALAFAVNQQMSTLSAPELEVWLRGRHARRRRTVGVLNPGNVPLAGLRDFLAVVLTGHRYFGSVSSRSPALLSAFAEEIRRRRPDLDAEFGRADDLFAASEAVIATGSAETLSWVRDQCDVHRIPPERRLLRGHSYAVAVLDGGETQDEYEGLAEDVLLHEGYGCRNVAVIWAPRDLSPDALLDAFAHFRGVFPAHERTPGRLAMQRAFLEAVGTPHAYGDGLEFLMSRGDPEAQQPGHVRWTEYDDLEDVNAWLEERKEEVQLVAAGRRSTERLLRAVPLLAFGEAQRPGLDWCPDDIDTIAFLSDVNGTG